MEHYLQKALAYVNQIFLTEKINDAQKHEQLIKVREETEMLIKELNYLPEENSFQKFFSKKESPDE